METDTAQNHSAHPKGFTSQLRYVFAAPLFLLIATAIIWPTASVADDTAGAASFASPPIGVQHKSTAAVNLQTLSDDDTSVSIMANGSHIRGFRPTQIINAYDPPVNASSTTLTITTRHPDAAITSVTPRDADSEMDGHQVTIDNNRLHDNTGVEIVVTAKDGTVVTNTLLIRGFSCNSRLNIGRVDHEERICYLLNTIAVKADQDYQLSDVVDLMNDQANWTVAWHSEHLRLIYAKRSPDNLTLIQLNQEANRILALPWASRVEKETFATATGDNTETQEEPDAPASTPSTPLTASFHTDDTPENHDGENTFTFELRFNEEPELSYTTLRDHAFTINGGASVKAKRLDPPSNLRWRITVEPDSDADVSVVLPATASCDDDGAICTAESKMLSNRSALTVEGPASESSATTNSTATGAPTIAGTTQAGQTLRASTSGIADDDGLSDITFAKESQTSCRGHSRTSSRPPGSHHQSAETADNQMSGATE